MFTVVIIAMIVIGSATGMLRALSRFLSGRDVPAIGQVPAALELPLSGLLGTLNRLPTAAQEWAYAASGWAGAIPLRKAGEVSSDALAAWVTGHYPHRRYPLIFIGSSNGALVHLMASRWTIRGVTWPPPEVRAGLCSPPTRTSYCTTCTIPIRTVS
ncbi:hypothetical protein [Streptomyces sp. PSKA30]|uniref:hypothetical protein n=1 Tax=Streptomyces sp. PSKA30 TaxID=2874597 RepID=UPI001CD0AC4B|nr:hypothetical protein [Streptomyces sp. PSKA30]MBZ9639224.1 hypothetical protein [Streptomyces sp. PSKA30]